MSTERGNGTGSANKSLFPAAKRFRSLASGRGAWRSAPMSREDEIAALQMAADLGMTGSWSTAESCAEGAAEELVAQALEEDRRRPIFLVSKVIASTCDATWHGFGLRGEPTPAGTQNNLDLLLSALARRAAAAGGETLAAVCERLERKGQLPALGRQRFNIDEPDWGRISSDGERRLERHEQPGTPEPQKQPCGHRHTTCFPGARSGIFPLMAYYTHGTEFPSETRNGAGDQAAGCDGRAGCTLVGPTPARGGRHPPRRHVCESTCAKIAAHSTSSCRAQTSTSSTRLFRRRFERRRSMSCLTQARRYTYR